MQRVMMMMVVDRVCSHGTGRRVDNIVMLMVQWIVEDHLSCVVRRVGGQAMGATSVSAWLAGVSCRRGGDRRSYGFVHG